MIESEKVAGGHAYRAKLMDEGGRIETTVPILAEDDAGALGQVRPLAQSYNVELWDDGKMVQEVPLERRGLSQT